MDQPPPTNENPTDQPGIIARYFLRRLALAHRKSNKQRVQYANALAETVLVFLGLPIAGFISFILVVTAKRTPTSIDKVLSTAPQFEQLIFGVVVMLVGYVLLNKKMKEYVDADSTCYERFSTDKDAKIVFWQRIGALIIFGILPAFLGLLVLALK